MENEIEFTSEMKRATPADIFRIYRQLWGDRFPYSNQTGETTMSIRTEVRATESHIKSMTSDRAEQIAIISKAQSLTIDNEHNIAVLAIVKNRIIRA